MTSSAILGIAFLLLALAAGGLMLRLWLYPYDEVNHVSSAPRSLLLLHRIMGYVFVTIYIVLMFRMVPRLWEWGGDFPTRTIIHAGLGIAIGCVLVLKVTILRFLPDYRKYLRILGSSIMVMTLAMLAVPLKTAVSEQQLSAQIAYPASQALVSEGFAAISGVGAEKAAELATEEALRQGRRAFLASCMQCHEIRYSLAKPRTAQGWHRLVGGMAKRAAKSEEAEDISPEDQLLIAAYLTAIRGLPKSVVAEKKAGTPATTETAGTGTPGAPTSTPQSAGSVSDGFAAVMDVLDGGTCISCHYPPSAPEKLNLDSLEGIMKGSDNGPIVIAGDPDASELIRRLRGESLPRMPLDADPLPEEDIAVVAEWIRSLVKHPSTPAPAGASEPTPTSGTAAAAPAAPARTPRPTPAPPGPGEPVLFSHVRPVLLQMCVKCHVAEGGKAGPPPEGLILSSWESALATRERPNIIPGNPDASALVRHIRGTEEPRMPFDGPPFLDAEQQSLVERWVRDGARDENGNAAPMPVGQEVRLRGTLSSQWIVDGVPFSVNAATEMRDARVGGAVEVRARIGANGELVAERVRGR